MWCGDGSWHERKRISFPQPIITPTTKADAGDDEDISRDEIIKQGIVLKADYEVLEDYTLKLYKRGAEMAAQKGLLLVLYEIRIRKNW